MADRLRAAFTSVTETVFPMSRSIRHNPRHHMLSTGLKILFYQQQPYEQCISLGLMSLQLDAAGMVTISKKYLLILFLQGMR